MKIALAQFAPTTSVERNLEVISGLVTDAVSAGAGLVLLPEEAMVTAEGLDDALAVIAERHWPRFAEHVSGLARDHRIAVIAPGYEPGPAGLPHNTMLVLDDSGAELARYRKMHLYDAFAHQESRYVMRGDVIPTLVSINGFTIGLLNCYDIRFPELARVLVELGAQVLAVSAAWAAGEHKVEHWLTLLQARAIENTCWVAATGSSAPECIGTSVGFDPMGVVMTRLENQSSALAFMDVSLERVDEVRFVVPVLRNRRIFIQGS